MKAHAVIASGRESVSVIDSVLDQMSVLEAGTAPELALVFASDAYHAEFPLMLDAIRQRTGAGLVLGCSGQGLIGPGREIEEEPALALQLISLPGAVLTPVRFGAEELATRDPEEVCREKFGGAVEAANALLLFVDPFSIDADRLLGAVASIRPDLPVIGGLASARYSRQGTFLFLDGVPYEEGAVGVLLGGEYTVRTVVSQGAAPLGETWTITAAEGNIVQTIGMRPALEVLTETFRALPPDVQERARSNLLIGLAMDEYRDEFRRGDFLIRNLLGVDQSTGAIAIGAYPRVGQTIQFQLRDPDAADEELRIMLARARDDLEGQEIAGALLCSCNGRGVGLFGEPDHDAKVLSETMGALPVAGFFCNGEIGPVGGKNFLHGFTASIGLIVRKEEA